MYTEHFGLKEKPFNLTPAPRFLYLSESHKEALALLSYGVMERKGFVLLTGEVGTGKTTILHTLLGTLDKRVQCVHLSNPLLSPGEFIDYLSHFVFKTQAGGQSKTEFLLKFEAYLRKSAQQQSNFLLVIDEAQKLSFELLEEIRLLSNMETADEKLINIFLVGQPELNQKLNETRCRPLLQRISIRHHISPLNLKETGEYIVTRLKVAGAKDAGWIFPSGAVKALHRCSRGYPRMINILGDNALLSAYSNGSKRITSKLIEQCYEDLQLDASALSTPQSAPSWPGPAAEATRRSSSGRILKWAVAPVMAAALAFGIAYQTGVLTMQKAGGPGGSPTATVEDSGQKLNVPVPSQAAAIAKAEESAPANGSSVKRTEPPKIAAAQANGSPVKRTEAVSREKSSFQEPASIRVQPEERPAKMASTDLFSAKAAQPDPSSKRIEESRVSVASAPESTSSQTLSGNGSSARAAQPDPFSKRVEESRISVASAPENASLQSLSENGSSAPPSKTEPAGGLPSPKKDESAMPDRLLVAKKGDTLSGLALDVYGRVDERILHMLQKRNPAITNVHWISIGQEIYFPGVRNSEEVKR